ncbi:DUF4272 domain-containing protein [Aureisphaera galaxeae]|uniref:DUF4272 domain-containing protein n=1 Tax=Aureisphaera galaxeae TaxID=1538023 RepID=UPI0023503C7F|nr:DUF4272 domain-containing protein [Aureisphaera galaxeae]MDC8004806.1 DUF4272 domain-containing protein [Aureisphaera galaxeae]
MFFRKKKKNNLVIQCTVCEWRPDGGKYWACNCGHVWNTFKSHGKCPKCETQYVKTWCPGCGKSTPHKDWYKTPEEIIAIEDSGDPILRKRKKSLESRLIGYGIKNYRVSHLGYLNYSPDSFQTPYEAGCRMMILYAISHAVHSLEDRPEIIQWLKEEMIWDRVSQSEKAFLEDPNPEEEILMDLSWRIESALTLGWCLNKVETLPKLDAKHNEGVFEELQRNIPEIGDSLMLFLTNLEFRNTEEILEENLVNELATTYFRDLFLNGQKDQTKINRSTSYERHQVLNWLRQFMDIEEWDETDTST